MTNYKTITTYKTENLEIQRINGKTISIQNTNWGWFVEVSDGYISEYMNTKKEAIAKRTDIKRKIKNKTW